MYKVMELHFPSRAWFWCSALIYSRRLIKFRIARCSLFTDSGFRISDVIPIVAFIDIFNKDSFRLFPSIRPRTGIILKLKKCL